MRHALSIVSLALLFASASARADDTAYTIKIQRPLKAAQKFTLSATNTLRSAERVELPNGDSNRTALFRRVIIEADVTIDKVDDAGMESSASIVVRKLTLQSSENAPNGTSTPKSVLEPGSQLTVLFQPNGQPVFTPKQPGDLSDEATVALQQGFKRMTITDAVYGTTDKKKLNDSWPMNTQAMGGDKTNPQYVDPSKITGSVKLSGVRPLAGIPCIQLDGTMTTKDFQVQGVAAKDATMTTLFSATLPTDADKPILAWSVRSTTHFVTEDKPLGQGTLRRTVDTEVQHEATRTLK